MKMNNPKILKSYRLLPEMVESIHRAAFEKGVSTTRIVSMALKQYFENIKNM